MRQLTARVAMVAAVLAFCLPGGPLQEPQRPNRDPGHAGGAATTATTAKCKECEDEASLLAGTQEELDKVRREQSEALFQLAAIDAAILSLERERGTLSQLPFVEAAARRKALEAELNSMVKARLARQKEEEAAEARAASLAQYVDQRTRELEACNKGCSLTPSARKPVLAQL